MINDRMLVITVLMRRLVPCRISLAVIDKLIKLFRWLRVKRALGLVLNGLGLVCPLLERSTFGQRQVGDFVLLVDRRWARVLNFSCASEPAILSAQLQFVRLSNILVCWVTGYGSLFLLEVAVVGLVHARSASIFDTTLDLDRLCFFSRKTAGEIKWIWTQVWKLLLLLGGKLLNYFIMLVLLERHIFCELFEAWHHTLSKWLGSYLVQCSINYKVALNIMLRIYTNSVCTSSSFIFLAL